MRPVTYIWQNVYKRWLAARLDIIDTIIFPDVARSVGQGMDFAYTGPLITITKSDPLPRLQ